MNGRLGWNIERVILIILIILGGIDFFGLLPYFWAYILDVVAWTGIAYVIYHVSPTELFFGERRPTCDFMIVIAYVILSLKDLIGNASASLIGLIQSSPSYIVFDAGNSNVGVPFTVTGDEFNQYMATHIVPRSAEIAQSIAPHFSMAREQLTVLLIDGTRQAAIVATPTTLNGTMLMFYNTLVANSAMIQMISLIVGFLLLVGISLYAAYDIPIQQPSVLSVLREEGKPTGMRPFWVFLILVGFFVMVFNLLFEWMTITNDAPLLILMAIFLLVIYTIHHQFKIDKFIENLGALGEDFYEKAIRLFMTQRTILLGISGFLVLHLITDIGNFIAPAILPWYKTLYVYETTGSHETLYAMIQGSLGVSIQQNALIVLAYLLSTLGLMCLLGLPALIWYKIFKMRTTDGFHLPDWNKWQIGFTLAIVSVYFLIPVFSFSSIGGGDLIGVNITSYPITADRIGSLHVALVVSLIILILSVIVGSLHDYVRRVLMLGPFGVTIIFFAVYIYYYFSSAFVYYSKLLVDILKTGSVSFAVLPMLFAIFGFTVFFFIAGFFSFLYEIWRD